MPPIRQIATLLALALATLALASCGGDDSTSGSGGHANMGHGSGSSSAGAAVDRAFAAAMIPHHESAIEMAKIAQDRGRSDFVKQLAAAIVTTQQGEIDTLKRIDAELERQGVKVGDLGVPAHMQGMEGDTAKLRDADPFDREFVDMMIPHHQGAIEMAKVEVAKGDNADLKKLAHAIIAAQGREIGEMNEFRKDKYGAEAPAAMEESGAGASSGPNKAHRKPEAMEK